MRYINGYSIDGSFLPYDPAFPCIPKLPDFLEDYLWDFHGNEGDGYIPTFVLEEMIEKEGFRIIYKMEETSESMYNDISYELRVIYVRKYDTQEHMRFSLGHDLCHILLNTRARMDRDQQKIAYGEENLELLCNHFAGKLLISREGLLKESEKNGGDAGMLSRTFEVSFECMRYRRFHEGLMDSKVQLSKAVGD